MKTNKENNNQRKTEVKWELKKQHLDLELENLL